MVVISKLPYMVLMLYTKAESTKPTHAMTFYQCSTAWQPICITRIGYDVELDTSVDLDCEGDTSVFEKVIGSPAEVRKHF